MSSGKIAQVIGPVVDVLFAAGEKLPEINNALVVYTNDVTIVVGTIVRHGKGGNIERTNINRLMWRHNVLQRCGNLFRHKVVALNRLVNCLCGVNRNVELCGESTNAFHMVGMVVRYKRCLHLC